MINNQFGKKIIVLNKKKAYLFVNAKSDEVFRRIIVFNVLSLWSYKGIVLQITV